MKNVMFVSWGHGVDLAFWPPHLGCRGGPWGALETTGFLFLNFHTKKFYWVLHPQQSKEDFYLPLPPTVWVPGGVALVSAEENAALLLKGGRHLIWCTPGVWKEEGFPRWVLVASGTEGPTWSLRVSHAFWKFKLKFSLASCVYFCVYFCFLEMKKPLTGNHRKWSVCIWKLQLTKKFLNILLRFIM